MSRPAARKGGRRVLAGCGLLAAALALQGCLGDTGEPVRGALRTGNFPNLNIKPESAAPQMTPFETRANRAFLATHREAVEKEGEDRPESDAERLREIGENHGRDALAVIEN